MKKLACLYLALLSLSHLVRAEGAAPDFFRSPFDMALSPDGQTLAVSDHTAGRVYLVDPALLRPIREVVLEGRGSGLAWRPDGKLFAAEYGNASVAQVDPISGTVQRRLDVSLKPQDVAWVDGLLVVSEYGLGEVQIYDPDTGERVSRVPVAQQPFFLCGVPGRSLVAVAHLIPEIASTRPNAAASVSLVDVQSGSLTAQVRLPYGSTNVRELIASPDGRWVYVLHTIGKVALPTTQAERGWINTNALSIIDVAGGTHHVSVLLDKVMRGAADPWGIALDEAGSTAWITLAGAHELAEVDLAGLHGLLDGSRRPSKFSSDSGSSGLVWKQVQDDPENRERLTYHLSALYGEGLLDRQDLPLDGPRAIERLPGGRLVIAGYFSGDLLFLDPKTGLSQTLSLGPQAEVDLARRGAEIFHDGRFSFQKWISCASCHPDARADGLNWDNLNDGLGNPKNTKTMLLSGRTPPMMASGIRPNYRVAIEKGMVHFQLYNAQPEELDAIAAYFDSLTPEPASETIEPGFAEAIERGRKVFDQSDCRDCHSGELYTDLKMHDVGSRGLVDHRDDFDTPSLIEVWRTAPYLHDGSVPTLEALFSEHAHGDAFGLSEDEVSDLVAFLKSL